MKFIIILLLTTLINSQTMDINILNSFLFHPRKAAESLGENDMLIPVNENSKVGVRFHLVNPKAPNILFFHGNGEIAPEYDDIASVYNQREINFIIADFRGYGFSTGTPSAENTQSDAHIILDFLLKHLEEKNYSGPLILMGRSLGSVSGNFNTSKALALWGSLFINPLSSRALINLCIPDLDFKLRELFISS